MPVPFASRVFVTPDVLVQELQGESVLLNLNGGRYFGLDEVGTRMWAVLTTSGSVQAAYDALLSEFDVDGETLRRDLADLLEKLMKHGLVAVDDK